MNTKTLCAAVAAVLSLGLATSAQAQQRHPDAADLAQPQSPVTQLLGSLSLDDEGTQAAGPVEAGNASVAESKVKPKAAADKSEAQLAGMDNTGRKSVGADKAATPSMTPEPADKAAPAIEPDQKVAEPSARAVVAEQPTRAPAKVTPAPVLIPDAVTERAQAPRVTLNPRERYFLQREAELVREIRLLELQAKAAELQKLVDAGDSRGLPMAPEMSTSNASSSGMPFAETGQNTRPPFRLISVWGEGTTLTADVIVNGVRMSVRKGDELPDGWLVLAIERGTMSIRRGSERLAMKLGS